MARPGGWLDWVAKTLLLIEMNLRVVQEVMDEVSEAAYCGVPETLTLPHVAGA